MKTTSPARTPSLKKGALTVADGEARLEDELAKARSAADVHGDRLPFNPRTESAESRIAAILRHTPSLIADGLVNLPTEHRPQVEQLLVIAINLGRALEAMAIQGEHGPKIETTKNLRVPTRTLTDEQICDALKRYPGREKQAKSLGITKRHLQRELAEMRRRGVTPDRVP